MQESTLVEQLSSLITLVRFSALGLILICELTYITKYQKKDYVLLGIGLIFFISAIVSSNTSLLQGYVFVFCLRRFNPHEILKIALFSIGVSVLVIVAFRFAGVIEFGDWYSKDGRGVRQSFGFTYPSRLPNYFLTIVLTIFILWFQRMTVPVFLLLLGISSIIFIESGSRNPFIFTVLSIVMLMAIKYDKSNKVSNLVNKLAIPIVLGCFAAILLLSIAYDQSNYVLEKLNVMLSGRLHFANVGMSKCGLSLFGSNYFEGIELANSNSGYLDSSYLRLIYYFGILPALLFLFGLVSCCKLLAKKGEIVPLAVIVCAAMHGVLEGQLILLAYSPFLIYILNRHTENVTK